MKIAGIDFPQEIWGALREGNLVVFVGAGVSKASGLPDFEELAEQIAEDSGKSKKDGESVEKFLRRLELYNIDVHMIAAQKLALQDGLKTELQKNLLRLFSDAGSVRIVTTNYDQLFEQAAEEISYKEIGVYKYPALPLGNNFNGIVHLHGAVDQPNETILTSRDFGKGYMHEKRASDFLLEMFKNFTVLFVGYGHNDAMMNYLTEPLPDSKQRFSLVPQGYEDKWEIYGIKPIYFQASGQDYGHLDRIIEEMVKKRDISISDRKKKIKEIAAKKPSIASDEDIKFIVDRLEDVVMVRSFANSARDPEWIEYLDRHNVLDNIFSNDSEREIDSILAWWLVNNFASECSDDIFRLIDKHNRSLNPQAWHALGLGIEPDDKNIFSRWVSVLLNTAPKDVANYGHVMLHLGERCAKYELPHDLLSIFYALLKNSLYISPEDDGMRHYYLNQLWKLYLKPIRKEVAEDMMWRLASQFQATHDALRIWNESGERWGRLSIRRSAIEEHEQDRHPEVFDVLIDAMRDCLEWLSKNEIKNSEYWCDRFAKSNHSILRRLAVYGMFKREDLTADKKIHWLLRNINFHDVRMHHEIFHATQSAYPKSSQNLRKKVIAEIKKYVDKENDRWTAHEHFRWFTWLHEVAPDCSLLQQALNGIKEKYPDFQTEDHPDFAIWMEEPEWISPESPFDVEELLSKPVAENFDDLLNCEDKRFPYPDSRRKGVLEVIKAAVKKNYKWGIDLAEMLSEAKEWDADVWDSLMYAWEEMDLDEGEYRQVLRWLTHEKLYAEHSPAVAAVLHSIVKDKGKPYVITLLPEAEKVASALWGNLKKKDMNEKFDWVHRAINHPSGKLAEFWLDAISVWRNKQKSSPDELPENYRKELQKICKDKTLPGRLGRTILASQLHFFLHIDESWTKENLIPLFGADDNFEDYEAAWDGFLTWGRMNPSVAKELEKYFMKAFDHIENIFKNERRDRFIKYYLGMINSLVDDNLSVYILKFFQHMDNNDRYILANQVWFVLRNLEGENQRKLWDKWLKSYWENRLVGKPESLLPGEIGCMIEWLPCLTEVFPEAVALAVAMPLRIASLEGRIVHELNESDSKLWDRYPEDVARLLVHLGESQSPSHAWDKLPALVDKLFEKGISPRHKRGLEELLAKLGFDFSD